jgi:hypothetical protein
LGVLALRGGARILGISRIRVKEEYMCLGPELILWDSWQALVNTIMNPWVP